jgi:hypothetical protein
MDEIRFAVVADAASGQLQGAARKICAIDAYKPHVDGAALQMQAVPRNTSAALAQLRVGLR